MDGHYDVYDTLQTIPLEYIHGFSGNVVDGVKVRFLLQFITSLVLFSIYQLAAAFVNRNN